MADLRAHGPSVNADVIDMTEQRRRNALFVLDVLLRTYVPKNTNDWRELDAALKTISDGVRVAVIDAALSPTLNEQGSDGGGKGVDRG